MEEEIVMEQESEQADEQGLDEAALRSENSLLKLKLECIGSGVRAECVDDVICLAQGSTVGEVLKKYPMFLDSRGISTGVSMKNSSEDKGEYLRKAFGLK